MFFLMNKSVYAGAKMRLLNFGVRQIHSINILFKEGTLHLFDKPLTVKPSLMKSFLPDLLCSVLFCLKMIKENYQVV